MKDILQQYTDSQPSSTNNAQPTKRGKVQSPEFGDSLCGGLARFVVLVVQLALMSLFVGRLPPDCRPQDLEEVFYKFGKITRCDVKKGLYFFLCICLAVCMQVASHVLT